MKASSSDPVLVVEDSPYVRAALIDVLETYGYGAVGAGDGREALELLRTGNVRPRLILLDLMMPRMDGWQFRTEQARDPSLSGIPVIVVSAYWQRQQDKAPAPAAFMPKPLDIVGLLQVMDVLIGRPDKGRGH